MKNAGKARSYGLYRYLRTSKEIIENLLNYSPYPIVMLREKNSENVIGIMKPEDGEIYETKDFHSFCYRKYIVQTIDFEIEKTQAICMGQFHYFPYLSDAAIVYGIEDVKKDESNEGSAIADGADTINNKNQNKSNTND